MNSHDLVLLGGGHTHVLLIRALAMRPIPGVRVTLVSENILTPYSGMLPGYVAGHYSLLETNIDLNRLCRLAGVRWINASANGIDPDRQIVQLLDQSDVSFDKLSIDIGSTPDLRVRGAADFAVGVKPISRFQSVWQSLLQKADTDGGSDQRYDWGVIGAGAGGVELVLAMAYRLRRFNQVRFHLVYRGENILPGYPAKMVTIVERHLQSNGIALHPDFSVVEVAEDGISGSKGQQLQLNESIWCTGATGADWLADCGLGITDRHFISVNRSQQSITHETIFAAGDIAEILDDPRPKAGVYAVRQAPYLEENLRRAFAGQPLKQFKLQRHFLSLLSLGDRKAVATRNGLVAQGRWVWRWKDYIDRKFMRQFGDFKSSVEMNGSSSETSSSETAMHCGGCGSKLGPALLLDNLTQLDGPAELDSPGESPGSQNVIKIEDASVWTPTPGSRSVQSIDGFRSLVTDESKFGRICVNHALSDIYAMGASVTNAQAWINLAFAHPRIQQRDHLRVLQGVVAALREQGVDLVGGHSSEGLETHVAIVANGELATDLQWSKTGVKQGDLLVLSKSLGSGVILAADMQGAAPAEAVEAACRSMLVSNQHSTQQLQKLAPHAVTDVTGFGLLGHLLEMLNLSPGMMGRPDTSSLGAVINLSSVPLLPGALQLSRSGWHSSLFPQLQSYLAYCETEVSEKQGDAGSLDKEILKLLLDPQTSGGLLASLPEAAARQLLSGSTDFVAIGRIEQRSGESFIRFSDR